MPKKGKLYLIPCTLGAHNAPKVLPPWNAEAVKDIRHFIVENDKSARRFLRAWMADFPLQACTWDRLNKHTEPHELNGFIRPLLNGADMGLISEAGLPAVADPGHQIVSIAHEKGIEVVPLVGPSSIMLALMSSGFNGQQFTFHGYLPKDRSQRIHKIKQLEKEVKHTGYTQLFMDTPFRNMHLLEDLLAQLSSDTLLAIGTDLTLETEQTSTKPVSYWRKHTPNLHKRPCIFSIGTVKS